MLTRNTSNRSKFRCLVEIIIIIRYVVSLGKEDPYQ